MLLSADRIEPLRVQMQTLAHLSKTHTRACCPLSPSNMPRHPCVHFLSAQGKRPNAPHKPAFRMRLWHYSHTHLSINNDVKQWFVFFTHHMSHIPSQARDSLTQSLINKNIRFYKIFISNKIVDCDKWRKLSQNLFKLTEIIFTVNIVYWYLLC